MRAILVELCDETPLRIRPFIQKAHASHPRLWDRQWMSLEFNSRKKHGNDLTTRWSAVSWNAEHSSSEVFTVSTVSRGLFISRSKVVNITPPISMDPRLVLSISWVISPLIQGRMGDAFWQQPFVTMVIALVPSFPSGFRLSRITTRYYSSIRLIPSPSIISSLRLLSHIRDDMIDLPRNDRVRNATIRCSEKSVSDSRPQYLKESGSLIDIQLHSAYRHTRLTFYMKNVMKVERVRLKTQFPQWTKRYPLRKVHCIVPKEWFKQVGLKVRLP
jgi:hypothetical protein